MPYNDEDEQLPYTTIGTDEARRMIEAGAQVIDVRRTEEWQRGHIPEAELVTISGIYSFGRALRDLQLPAGADVIFVCASGQRSATAAEIALVAGMTKVYNLANGMHGWVDRGYPVER
jgi:rhodanese-related sulfurtransferase